jgi:hypothetical protein
VLVETGFWPETVPFEADELATVVAVINDRAKQAQKGARRAR